MALRFLEAPGQDGEGSVFRDRECYVFNKKLHRDLDDGQCKHCRFYLTLQCKHIKDFLDEEGEC
jgi:hypothetical protein